MTPHADIETHNKILNQNINVKFQSGWINLFAKDLLLTVIIVQKKTTLKKCIK